MNETFDVVSNGNEVESSEILPPYSVTIVIPSSYGQPADDAGVILTIPSSQPLPEMRFSSILTASDTMLMISRIFTDFTDFTDCSRIIHDYFQISFLMYIREYSSGISERIILAGAPSRPLSLSGRANIL